VTGEARGKEEFPICRSSGIMQAFVSTQGARSFSDPRVRRAFNLALDFEEMNNAVLLRPNTPAVASYYEGTELASGGLPGRPRA